MKGYIFTTETEAIAARKAAATYMGLPVPKGETLYWVNYNYSDLDGFWYITYVEGLDAALGEPIEFEITYPPLPYETN
jgi:hypothetical protein